nr:transposase [Streptomyces sp. NRRL S-1824]
MLLTLASADAPAPFVVPAGVIAACHRAGAHFSLTTGMNPSIKRAVHSIPEDAWQHISYPTAVPDPATGELISDAEVAEIPEYTAFASRTKAERVTARLIVRRVRDLAKPAVMGEQGELFPVWRYVVEQVIADTKAGALAHLPSGHFHANAAWLTLWAMTYNLLRAAGALTSPFHTKATTATLRSHLVQVPARIARSARRITLHLPHNWPWQQAWTHLFDTVHDPPAPAWKSWADQQKQPAHPGPDLGGSCERLPLVRPRAA